MPPRRAWERSLSAEAQSVRSWLGCAGLQRQRVQFAAHFALERRVNDLVLLDARFAAKRLGNDRGGIMVAIPREVADGHFRVGNAGPDQPLYVARSHRHGRLLT